MQCRRPAPQLYRGLPADWDGVPPSITMETYNRPAEALLVKDVLLRNNQDIAKTCIDMHIITHNIYNKVVQTKKKKDIISFKKMAN